MHCHQDERDQYTKYLVEMFPKAFFEDPEQRLPLKKNIITDLGQQCSADNSALSQALGWYQSHFSYQRKLLSGADRIDLAGKKAGTVTLQEQEAARRSIAARKKEMADRRAGLAAPAKPAVMNGHAKGAPAMVKTSPPTPPPSPAPAAPIAALHNAVAVAVEIIGNRDRYGALRAALATTALRQIIADAETLIGSLQQEG
jgi:sRNA-binding protein